MTYFAPRPIRLIGGRYDGRWWNNWHGESMIEVRFLPKYEAMVEVEFDPNVPPMATTTDVERAYYQVGFVVTDSGRTKLAFAYPETWTEGDALRHLLGNPCP